jgi:FkbM family methyltransferase
MPLRQQVQKALRAITPPLVLTVYKKSPLHGPVRRFFNKPSGDNAPAWHTIAAGELAGLKIFANTAGGFGEMVNGSYDQFFFDYLKKLDLAGKTIYDIGSHVGFNALYFAKLVGAEGRVVAFEPNEFNARRFRQILSGNPELASRITIFELAIANRKGSEDFLFSDNVDGGTSSGSFIESADTLWQKEVYEKQIGFVRKTVPTLPLDQAPTELSTSGQPALIKIDVEGAEYLVLEGGKQLITAARPILLVEIHSIFNMFRVSQLLTELAYEVELLKEEADGRCFIAARPSNK